MQHNYFIYILNNKKKAVLYIGVTNDVENRLRQHIRGDSKFAALAGVSTNRNKDKKHPQLVSPPTEIMVK